VRACCVCVCLCVCVCVCVFSEPCQLQWLRERMAAATNVGKDQLEPTKMTQYTRGAFFAKHSDASFLNEKMWARAQMFAWQLVLCVACANTVACACSCDPSAWTHHALFCARLLAC